MANEMTASAEETKMPNIDDINAEAIEKAKRETEIANMEDSEPDTIFPQPVVNDAETARYEVNVTNYAHYEKHDEVYTPETKKCLSYAARTPFVRFFLDFAAILAHPAAFWRGQDLHPATLGQLHWPHLTLLILLRTIAVFIGGILQPDPAIHQVIIQAVTQGLLIFLLTWAMALIVAGISALSGGGFHYDKALRFVGYGITPLLFAGLIGIIPLPWLSTVCDLLAMPWAFVVMGAGVLPYLKIKSDNAPIISALICGLLLCLWGAMPMLIPFLLSFKLL